MDGCSSYILKRSFFQRDTAIVAKDLLGKILVKRSAEGSFTGIIIETEAYYGIGDPASHAYRGMTPRSRLMFGKAGIAYIYLCYGVYWLLNVVTERTGTPGAVLIRGLKPIEGIESMRKRRKVSDKKRLTDGPGKLTIAMGISGADNGIDMTAGESSLYIGEDPDRKSRPIIENTSRIGITDGKEKMLRYIAIGL
ncbi:MAG TPA: DNA-3-methyladenine glycosylase [Actinobacteria bacterium]|nr:DNA-3-methyladenine glycosylase [Actinomycetota bacterium]